MCVIAQRFIQSIMNAKKKLFIWMSYLSIDNECELCSPECSSRAEWTNPFFERCRIFVEFRREISPSAQILTTNVLIS